MQLSSTIYITGEGASQGMADDLNKNVSSQFESNTSNGVTVSFNVAFEYSKDGKPKEFKDGDNILTVHNGEGKSEGETPPHTPTRPGAKPSAEKAPNSGDIYVADEATHIKNDLNYVIFHETLHMFGLADRYHNNGNQSQADKGFPNDAMGVYGSFKINDTHYRDYINYANSPEARKSSVLKNYVDWNTDLRKTTPSKKDLESDNR